MLSLFNARIRKCSHISILLNVTQPSLVLTSPPMSLNQQPSFPKQKNVIAQGTC